MERERTMQKVRVVGAGMTRFGKYLFRSVRGLAEEAVRNAVQDAGLDIQEIHAAYVSNSVAGLITGQETIRGQVMLRHSGLMGIPISPLWRSMPCPRIVS